MKKIYLLIVALIVGTCGIKAASFSLTATCPTTADPSAVVNCTISAVPNGFTIAGMQMSYSFSGATFNSFTTSSAVSAAYSNSSSGAVLRLNETSSSVSIGTLKINMPSSGSASVTLNNIVGSQADYAEYSASNVTKTIRVKSAVNTLSSLTLSNGTLSPSFNAETTSYTATIDASSVTVNATKTDNYSSITGDGTKSLNYGTNTINVVVTAESGAKKTYTIVITRPDNRDTVNTLSALTISSGTLSPVFTSSTASYTVSVAANTTKVTISATKSSAKSSFVNGYGSRDVNLEYGSNKILIKVLSENEKEKVYTITITRQDNRSTNCFLKSLAVNEGTITFDKNTLEYAVTVNYVIDKITITGAADDSKSTVTGLGVKSLNVGSNVLNIVVTAENTSTKTYKLIVNRLSENESPNSNTNLKTFTIVNHTINFDNETSEYEIELGADEDILDLSYEVDNANAAVTVIGNENLKNGSIVTVKVTATDGTIKEYKIKIIKPTTIDDTITNTSKGGIKLSLGLIIGIISVLVILIVIIIFLIVSKKRKKKNESSHVDEIINIE